MSKQVIPWELFRAQDVRLSILPGFERVQERQDQRHDEDVHH